MDFTKIEQLKISPQTILDIGANVGEFASQAHRLWPDAYFFLIEANPKCEPYLQDTDFPYLIQALSSERKSNVPFYTTKVNSVNTGDSLYKETSTNLYDSENCIIQYITTEKLDDIFDETEGSFDLIKIDTQGSEIDIIKGGLTLVKKAKWVLLEVSIVPCNENAVLIDTVINYMTEIGFGSGIDIESHYDKGELKQKDIIFTNENI